LLSEGGDRYRYGYQGLSRPLCGREYAEDETEETGWNAFEARMYDPVIGRWISIDPARQFASPYLGMGNDPINGVDPDGRDWYKDNNTGKEVNLIGVTGDVDGYEWIWPDNLSMKLEEVEISAGLSEVEADAVRNGKLPTWMTFKAEFVTNFSAAIRYGKLSYEDKFIYGQRYDVGSVDLINLEFGYDRFNDGGYVDLSSGNVNFSYQIEALYGDYESKLQLNPFKESYKGTFSTGYKIIRTGANYDSVHGTYPVIGFSENWARSIGFGSFNAGIEVSGFIGARFSGL
jgi:RHS repeat-associated protein